MSFTKTIPLLFLLAIHTSSLQLFQAVISGTLDPLSILSITQKTWKKILPLSSSHYFFLENTEDFDRAFNDPSLPETLYKCFQTWIQTSGSLQGYLEWCFNKNVTNTSYPSYKWGLAYPGGSLCSPAHFFRGLPTPVGLPAHLTCSSLHIPSSPTAILLFFFWYLSVRLAFDTLSISAGYKRWYLYRYQPKQAGLYPVPPQALGSPVAAARRSMGYVLLCERSRAPQRLITSRKNHYSYLKLLSCTSAPDRAWALVKEWVSKLGLSSSY